MKGITPIIAVIVLLLITIALAGAAYTYINVYSGSLTQKTLQVTDAFCDSGGSGAVVILNGAGTQDITTSTSQAYLPDSDTVALWHADTAGSFPDDPTPGNDGLLGGGNPANESVFNPTGGKIGGAYDFNLVADGTNDYILVADAPELNFDVSDSFTLEAWINAQDTGATAKVILNKQDGAAPGYRLLILGTTDLLRLALRDSAALKTFSSTAPVPENVLTHVMAVRDGAAKKVYLYINGVDVTPTDNIDTTTGTLAATASVYIGVFSTQNLPFKGTIDEIRISRSIRSPAARSGDNWQCQVAGSSAGCGDITVSTGGSGFQPYFSAATLPRGGTATFKDASCTGTCDYSFGSASIGSAQASVRC
ncbi:MAG: hypothetical protein HY367_00790 [Candidatus Aenigmarchaeota archaeon]|nr:hypothetical protein [Candidatus Aenigmarchaeota archaeon]